MDAIWNCCWGSAKHDEATKRERWDSRFAFILATCGSAIGLGNLWRFPALAYEHGGGAFFIPYLLALFLIGIPLSVLELALGQVVQSGDIACFGSMHRRLRGIGLGSVFGAFMVVCYYNVIVTWSLIYLVTSFSSPLPWQVDENASGDQILTPATNFFANDVLKTGAVDDDADVIVGNQFAALLFTWIVIASIVWKGVSRTSKVVYVTMFLPLMTLIVLMVRGATLEGAGSGIVAYVGRWDLAALNNGAVWSQAVGQIFFSIGVTFGIMTAYSSYNSRFQNTVQDALIVSLINSAVSIFAGFAVFSVLGHLSHISGVSIEGLGFSGPGLAFVTYPVALAQLPGSNVFNILFFLTLFFLGIDSAFSMVEAVTTAVKDSAKYHMISRGVITGTVVVFGFLIGCVYITNLGSYFLGIVDAYVSNVGMLFVGFMEAFSSGWIYRLDEHTQVSGARAVYTLMGAWMGGTLVGCIVGHVWTALGGFFVAVGLILCGSAASVLLAMRHESAEEHSIEAGEQGEGVPGGKMWKLFMFPVEALRSDLNRVILRHEGSSNRSSGTSKKWAIPLVWSFLIRYVIPPVLIIMLSLSVQTYAAAEGYDGLPAKYQAAGMIAAGIIVALVLVPMVAPELLNGLIPAQISGAQTLGALVPIDTIYGTKQEYMDYTPKSQEKDTRALGVIVNGLGKVDLDDVDVATCGTNAEYPSGVQNEPDGNGNTAISG